MKKYKKREDGRYARQVKIGEKGGKPIKKTIYAKTQEELDKKYRDLMFLVDRNIVMDNQSITLSKLRDEWYRINIKGKVRRNTECGYASVLKRFEPIESMKIKDIKKFHIEGLISDIINEGYENTAKSVLSMLRKIFNYAIDNELLYKNPCNGLKVKHKAKAKRVLTDEEKKILDTENIELRDKAFLYLLRYTGIRRGEIFALQKSDIDRDKMIIHIRKTLVDNNGSPYVQDLTKTEAGDRSIPIFLKLAKPLFDYIDIIDDYLFLNKNGKLMACNSMKIMIDNMKSKYGLGSDLTAHCFRYNFVSECYLAGVDIKKTQAWAGHDDVSTTLNVYTKLSNDEIFDGSIMNDYYESQKKVKNVSGIGRTTIKIAK